LDGVQSLVQVIDLLLEFLLVVHLVLDAEHLDPAVVDLEVEVLGEFLVLLLRVQELKLLGDFFVHNLVLLLGLLLVHHPVYDLDTLLLLLQFLENQFVVQLLNRDLRVVLAIPPQFRLVDQFLQFLDLQRPVDLHVLVNDTDQLQVPQVVQEKLDLVAEFGLLLGLLGLVLSRVLGGLGLRRNKFRAAVDKELLLQLQKVVFLGGVGV